MFSDLSPAEKTEEKGKLMNTFETQINKNSLVSVQEVGLKELLQEASKY